MSVMSLMSAGSPPGFLPHANTGLSAATARRAADDAQPGWLEEHKERDVLELIRAWLGGVQLGRRAAGVARGLVAAYPLTDQLHPEVAPQLMHL